MVDLTSHLPTGCLPCLLPRHSLSFLTVAKQCGVALAATSPLLCAQELESTAALCFKAAEGSTDVVRSSVAELLGQLLIASQQPLPPHQKGKVGQGTLHGAGMVKHLNSTQGPRALPTS